MVAYNHEEFIAEAIDGVIMQKTNFPIEIVLGEDFSTDNTRMIVQRYVDRYPEIIKPLFHKKNIGMMANCIQTIRACKGKYIAMCEGDDYWTDPLKLQKQVDFLEANPDFSMCAHNSDILEYGELKKIPPINGEVFSIEDIISLDWGIMTATIMFRRDALEIPDWFSTIKNDDYGIQLLVSLKGKVKVLPEAMSVYRKHVGGISTTLRPLSQAAWVIYLLYQFNKYTSGKYKSLITGKIKRIYKNQIGFAKEYHLRKATAILLFYRLLVPIYPFSIRSLRK
jgi:glycosyltransferase involved in cell wall biosynthesis